jgi:hypothetical protein
MELRDVMKRYRTQSRWTSMGMTLKNSAKFIGDITVTHHDRGRSYLERRKCWLNWYRFWFALLAITVSIPERETDCPDLKGFVVFLSRSRSSLGNRSFKCSRVVTYGRTDRRGSRRVFEAFLCDLQKRLHLELLRDRLQKTLPFPRRKYRHFGSTSCYQSLMS